MNSVRELLQPSVILGDTCGFKITDLRLIHKISWTRILQPIGWSDKKHSSAYHILASYHENSSGYVAVLLAHVNPLYRSMQNQIGELVNRPQVSDQGSAVAEENDQPFVEFL